MEGGAAAAQLTRLAELAEELHMHYDDLEVAAQHGAEGIEETEKELKKSAEVLMFASRRCAMHWRSIDEWVCCVEGELGGVVYTETQKMFEDYETAHTTELRKLVDLNVLPDLEEFAQTWNALSQIKVEVEDEDEDEEDDEEEEDDDDDEE